MAVNVHDTIFALQGKHSTYVLGIENGEYVRHIYWGKQVKDVRDFELKTVERIDSQDAAVDATPEEYPPFGGLRYKSIAIKASFSDGTRDLVFQYINYSLKDNVLIIHLKDKHYNLFINLYYKMYEDLDILERWVEIENKESDDIILEQVNSAAFNFPGTDYYSTQVFGHFASEQRMFREKVYPGKKVFESRKGISGNNHNPYFILDKGATEDTGEVYFGVLAYGGNYNVVIERTQFHKIIITLGISSFDSSYRLLPKQTFKTPSVFAGYTDKGFSAMSNTMYDLARNHLMPKEKRATIHPVLYNSWEATKFTFTVAQQIELAKRAAKIGVELFVIDDGWFGKRDSDKAGLGDWVVNKKKFPKGLNELIDKVHEFGMEFGLWVEPEMVNFDSDIYRSHPDWIYQFEHREPTLTRNQLVLNLTRKEVKQYIFNSLDRLLTEHPIAYIKWDMNRPISEPGAKNLEALDQRSMWYEHTMALYDIVDRLRKKHPKVTFEACASGGSRVNYGSLMHFDQFWISDNTDGMDRLLIQEGYSYLYPIKAMRAWVTDCPNIITKKTVPLEFRFHSAMMGILGIGGNLTNYTQEQLDIAKEKIAEYKRIRHIVQDGYVYRLLSHTRSPLHAVQYVYKNKESVLFAFLSRQPYIDSRHLIRLKGLNPTQLYEIEENGQKFTKHGSYLMSVGLEFKWMGDYLSKLIYIRAV